LDDVARKATESPDLEELLNKVLSEVVEIKSLQLGAIYVFDDSIGRPSSRAHVGFSEEQMAKIEKMHHTVPDWSKPVASDGQGGFILKYSIKRPGGILDSNS